MTLQEAIKRLINVANEKWEKDELKDADACQLGIEAGKRLRENRNFRSDIDLSLLPGETED